jgi:hypothetical protein
MRHLLVHMGPRNHAHAWWLRPGSDIRRHRPLPHVVGRHCPLAHHNSWRHVALADGNGGHRVGHRPLHHHPLLPRMLPHHTLRHGGLLPHADGPCGASARHCLRWRPARSLLLKKLLPLNGWSRAHRELLSGYLVYGLLPPPLLLLHLLLLHLLLLHLLLLHLLLLHLLLLNLLLLNLLLLLFQSLHVRRHDWA